MKDGSIHAYLLSVIRIGTSESITFGLGEVLDRLITSVVELFIRQKDLKFMIIVKGTEEGSLEHTQTSHHP